MIALQNNDIRRQSCKRNLLPVFMTVLRIFVGWHFLYEGIAKLTIPGWSSATYLVQSKWLLAGFFHWLISNPVALQVTDFLNVWGLIFIGLGLFLGIFTRMASLSGILLLLMYYMANPPFVSSGLATEGHDYVINKNLIEAGLLAVFVIVKKDDLWGLDRLIKILHDKQKDKKFPVIDNHEIPEGRRNTRRELVKNLAVVPVLGGALFGMAKKSGWLSFEEENLKKTDGKTSASVLVARQRDISQLKGKVPLGKIKNVEFSRIIPGGNLINGYAHARDLIYVSPLIGNYFTDEKIIETLWLYEACGINTTIMSTNDQTIRLLKEFWRRGGKIQWLAQTYPKGDDFSNIQMAVDNGATGAFVMGGIADRLIRANNPEDLAKPIAFIRNQGLPGGTAAHSINVPKACVDHGIEVDFFMKTFHHDQYWSAHPRENRGPFSEIQPYSDDHNRYHDNMWCVDAEETKTFFKSCQIPWIAYKVLAAGAIAPEDGLRFAYENGADFTCVGMFDFQVIENANFVHSILHSDLNRERKWYS